MDAASWQWQAAQPRWALLLAMHAARGMFGARYGVFGNIASMIIKNGFM
jgi:hypothetical protein